MNNQLFSQNINFAKYLANRYCCGDNFDDCYQEALIGLNEASEKYNGKLGKFSNFAKFYIKGRILKYLAKNKYQFSLPFQKFLNNTEEKNILFRGEDFVSKDFEDIDIIDDNKYSNNQNDYKDIINQYLDILTPKEQTVISLVLGLNDSPKNDFQISQITKNSISRIQDIRRSATKKLSCAIRGNDIEFDCAAQSSHEKLKQQILEMSKNVKVNSVISKKDWAGA